MPLRIDLRLLAAAALLAASPGLAQTPAATPTASVDSVPEKIAPGAKPTEPAENLTQKLDQSNGVIHPKANVDPAMQKPAPQTGDVNALPPPGTTNGAPAPQPK